MAAFYMACASFMSQNYGAGKPDRVKKSYFISLAYSFGVGLALGGGLFLFGRQFLALFTTESAVIDAGMKRGLLHFGLYGLHHRRFPRSGQDCGAHCHRHHGFLCVPGDLGIHHLRPLPHHPLALPALPLLLGSDRHCGDSLFHPLLQAGHEDLPGADPLFAVKQKDGCHAASIFFVFSITP